jgi:hypothetical protein
VVAGQIDLVQLPVQAEADGLAPTVLEQFPGEVVIEQDLEPSSQVRSIRRVSRGLGAYSDHRCCRRRQGVATRAWTVATRAVRRPNRRSLRGGRKARTVTAGHHVGMEDSRRHRVSWVLLMIGIFLAAFGLAVVVGGRQIVSGAMLAGIGLCLAGVMRVHRNRLSLWP